MSVAPLNVAQPEADPEPMVMVGIMFSQRKIQFVEEYLISFPSIRD